MEAGASVALANDKNYVPLDLAGFGEKFEVVDYFLERSGALEGENAKGDGLVAGVEGVSVEEGEGEGEEGEEVVVMRAGEGVVEEGEDRKGKGKGKGEEVKGTQA